MKPDQLPSQSEREALGSMPRRVFVLGATGTIGRATVRALLRRGHEVVCLVRARAGVGGVLTPEASAKLLPGVTLRVGDVGNAASLATDGFCGEHFDVLVSCLASRTGAPKDAWDIDHRAHVLALNAAKQTGVTQVVLLSAICVQRPRLAFQHAKLAFEKQLMDSGLSYSIVRPTAFFKSLSGQVDRLKRGKPFLVFGDGRLTACKPISDDDLAEYLAGCIDDASRQNRVLPIGGPGKAITPRQQGEQLFALLGRPPRFKQVPVALLDAIIAVLGLLGRMLPALADKAELARIGRYYATESMLVLGSVQAAATTRPRRPRPATTRCSITTPASCAARPRIERGDHAVF